MPQSCFIKGVNLSKALRTVPGTAFTQKVLSILGKSIKSMENYCERLQNGPKNYCFPWNLDLCLYTFRVRNPELLC